MAGSFLSQTHWSLQPRQSFRVTSRFLSQTRITIRPLRARCQRSSRSGRSRSEGRIW